MVSLCKFRAALVSALISINFIYCLIRYHKLFLAKMVAILYILGSMVSHQRVIVDLSQSEPALGWGSPLHAWLASVNWIGCSRYLNRGYRYGARGMHYHILLWQYSRNYYTYNSVVQNTYSPCHKDACVQISIVNTKWLLRYKGVS